MQWDDSEYAGFGDAGCWFTINPNYKTINVKNQLMMLNQFIVIRKN